MTRCRINPGTEQIEVRITEGSLRMGEALPRLKVMSHGPRLLIIRISGLPLLRPWYLSCPSVVEMPSFELFNGWISQRSSCRGHLTVILATELDGDPTLFE
jgi:hypothetical protein